MFNPTRFSGISTTTSIKDSSVETVSHQIGNASNVPAEYLDIAERHANLMLERSMAITTKLDHAEVEHLKIDVGNIITTTTFAVLPKCVLSEDNGESGKILWNFSGKNELRTVTLQIEDRAWHEQFTRLRLPTSPLLLGETRLRPKAHRTIYENLCTALEPVDRSMSGNVVILQGASGLGKTYCVQHYFYHQAAQRHQMVVWLTGASKEAFLHGWNALAQQLRTLDTGNHSMDDDSIIKHWCENQLGQWLLIIDEVDVDAEYLKERLPKKGGHVVITTHRPDYQLHQTQRTFNFYTLSKTDSQSLLQLYVGQHWKTTGHAQEQEALDYLGSALGGFPVALVQMALLAHKKGISFERLAYQFKQPQLTAYLLDDAIYDQLRHRTFISSVQKGWWQLLNYLLNRYPKLDKEQHKQNLQQFIDFLYEKKLAYIPETTISYEEVSEYWQAIALFYDILVFNVDELMKWLSCLPWSWCNDTQQWTLSLAGISALSVVYDKKQISIFQAVSVEMAEQASRSGEEDLSQANSATFFSQEEKRIPQIPEKMLMSISLENSRLKNVEINLATVGRPSEFTAWQLPTRNPYFIPRPKLIEELTRKLPIREKGEASAQLLLTAATGMGGIGKTELARHYAAQSELSDHYQKHLWLTATSDSMLRIEFQQLAAYLGLIELEKYIEDETLINHIHKWLSIHPGWLMVLDNADNYSDIERWIPREGGAVLVTTREPNPGTLSREQIVPIPLLDVDEAVDWLYQLSQRKRDYLLEEEIIARKLVEDLGCVPLAIAQAAAYLREQATISIANYQTRFIELMNDATLANQGNKKMIKKNSDAYSRLIITSTWSLSLYAIETYTKSIGMQNIAEPILNSCAYLAPQDIPIILMEHWLKNLTHEVELNLIGYMLDEYVGQLIRYSLIERNDKKNTISIHRLVQDVFQYKAQKNKSWILSDMNSTLDKVISENIKLDAFQDKALLPHAEALFHHGKLPQSLKKENNDQKNPARLIIKPKKLGHLYTNLGLWKKAEEFYREALRDTKICDEKNYFKIISSKNDLAIILMHTGQYDEAKDLLLQCFTIQEKIDPTSMIMAVLQDNFGSCLCHYGESENAEKYFKMALEVRVNFFGEDNIVVANLQRNLASCLANQKKYLEALVLYKKSLITKVIFHKDEKCISVTNTQRDIANILTNLSKFDDAKELYEIVLQNTIQHYSGENYIEVAVVKMNFSKLLIQCKEYERAEFLSHQAFKIAIEHYSSEDHIEVAKIRGNLACAELKLEKYPEAEKNFRQVLLIMIKSFGEIHSETIQTKLHLALTLDQSSQFNKLNEAERLFEEVLESPYYQKEITETAKLKQSFSTVKIKLKKFSEAISLINNAIQIFRTQSDGEQYLENCLQAKELILTCRQSLLQFRYKTKEADQAIRRTAGTGDHDGLKYLLCEFPDLINTPDKKINKGYTPLHLAVQYNRIQCVQELLLRKARYDVADKTESAFTAIDICLKRFDSIMIQLLTRHIIRAYLKDGDSNMEKALRIAAHNGDLPAVKLFIAQNVNINTAGLESGKTALIQATIKKHYDVVQFLITHDAEIAIMDNLGNAALDYAKHDSRLVSMFSQNTSFLGKHKL